MPIRFDGDTAIVAAAAGGIGQAIARSRVTVPSPATCLSTGNHSNCGRLNGVGEIIAVKVDVTGETPIAELVREAGGPADVLVYRAGGRPAAAPRRGDPRRLQCYRRCRPESRLSFRQSRRPSHEGQKHRTHHHHLQPGEPRHELDWPTKPCGRQTRTGRRCNADCPGALGRSASREFDCARLHDDQPPITSSSGTTGRPSWMRTLSTIPPCAAWECQGASPMQ